MLVAEELDVGMDQVVHAAPDTWVNATGGGGGSGGISSRALPVRAAAVRPGRRCSSMASTQLGVPVASLSVSNGVVSGGGKSVTYGELIGGKRFDVTMNPPR